MSSHISNPESPGSTRSFSRRGSLYPNNATLSHGSDCKPTSRSVSRRRPSHLLSSLTPDLFKEVTFASDRSSSHLHKSNSSIDAAMAETSYRN